MRAPDLGNLIRRSLLLVSCSLGIAVTVVACASGSSTDETTPGNSTGGKAGSGSGGKGGKAGSTSGGSGGETTAGSGGSAGDSGGGSAGETTGGSAGDSAGGSDAGTGGDGGSAGEQQGGAGGSDAGSGGSDAGTGGSGGSTAGSGGSDAGSGGSSAGSGNCNQPEVCNGLDDNCNGVIDEGDPGGGALCDVPGAKGACVSGTQTCKKGGKLECVPSVQPSPEVCDGVDNDCNGLVDDLELTDSCDTGLLGICKAGTKACENGQIVCKQNLQPLAETCNGLDDNCDGSIDEGSPGAGQDCKVDGIPPLSPCAKGKTACGAGGQITCVQVVDPTPEVCDGADNDCNGTIDDPAVVNGQPCDTGLLGLCGEGTSSCQNGSGKCNIKTQPNSVPETCNGIDDDCDGQIDNDSNPANDNLLCANSFPSAQFVSAWACNAGKCDLNACQTGHVNIDGAPGNGCECAADQYGVACSNATTLAVSYNNSISKTGVIASDNGEAWFSVSFTNFPAVGTGSTTHFLVELVGDGGGQYTLAAFSDCGVLAQCPLPGADAGKTGTTNGPENLTSWEFKATYDGNCSSKGKCSNGTTPFPAQMFFRVQSKSAASCNPYTVKFSNLTN